MKPKGWDLFEYIVAFTMYYSLAIVLIAGISWFIQDTIKLLII